MGLKCTSLIIPVKKKNWFFQPPSPPPTVSKKKDMYVSYNSFYRKKRTPDNKTNDDICQNSEKSKINSYDYLKGDFR